MIYFHGCTESAALIYIKSYQTLLALTDPVGLLMIRKKKILQERQPANTDRELFLIFVSLR